MLLLINNSTDGNTLSFIRQLRHALKEQHIQYIETNTVDENIIKNKRKIKGIIISGSPMLLNKHTIDNYNYDIYYLLQINVPVLGICFGCQLLTLLNGGTLYDRKQLFCDNVDINMSTHFLFNNMENKQLDFCFTTLPVAPKKTKIIKEIAWINIDGRERAIAFEFEKNKLFGILGHPELNKNNWIVYKNFNDFCSHKFL